MSRKLTKGPAVSFGWLLLQAFCFSLFLQRCYVCGQVSGSITRREDLIITTVLVSDQPNRGGPFPWPAVRNPLFARCRFDMASCQGVVAVHLWSE